MRDLPIRIVRIPNLVNPWDVLFIIELVKMLNKQSLVLAFGVDDSQPPFLLGLVYFFQTTMGLLLLVIYEFPTCNVS
jgi:hypothetical protein